MLSTTIETIMACSNYFNEMDRESTSDIHVNLILKTTTSQ